MSETDSFYARHLTRLLSGSSDSSTSGSLVEDTADLYEFPKLSETPGRIEHLGPPLGNKTDEVLGELLGLTVAELSQFHKNHVI